VGWPAHCALEQRQSADGLSNKIRHF